MSWNQAHAPHPSLTKSSPKKPRTQSEASRFSGSHNYNTKQNKTKLPSFIDGSLHIKMFDTNMMVTHPLTLPNVIDCTCIMEIPHYE
jgi:hypothetical protein